MKKLARMKYTVIFYESCHRILATLQDIQTIFGDKEVVVARELTKKFEEIKRGRAQDILEAFKKQKPRGEFVVVI
jgi:16S rRNA (cytidine1402-2'-O)-methyltransferase